MRIDQLKPNVIVRGPILPEPVQVIVIVPMGESVKLVGKGLNTGRVHEPILNAGQVATLEATPEKESFDGDPQKFRLGIEALRLGLAYEYDPYFALSPRPEALSCCTTGLGDLACIHDLFLFPSGLPSGATIVPLASEGDALAALEFNLARVEQ